MLAMDRIDPSTRTLSLDGPNEFGGQVLVAVLAELLGGKDAFQFLIHLLLTRQSYSPPQILSPTQERL